MNNLYLTCINYKCHNEISSYGLELQEKFPRTPRFRMCSKCKRRGRSTVLHCEKCGILSIDITNKYCRDCARIIQKTMTKDAYIKAHPRGLCICGIKIKRAEHGGRWKYCSDKCMVDARRVRSKEWQIAYWRDPIKKKKRQDYQKAYFERTKEARLAYHKKYRKTERYRVNKNKYYEDNKHNYLSLKLDRRRLDDKVYILETIKRLQ